MAEYIERESALYEAEKYACSKGCVSGRHSGIADIIADNILKIPAADVRPERHGSWEWSKLPNGYNDFKCSACGAREVTTITPHSWTKDGYHEYCGVCGAKMDGGKNNEID